MLAVHASTRASSNRATPEPERLASSMTARKSRANSSARSASASATPAARCSGLSNLADGTSTTRRSSFMAAIFSSQRPQIAPAGVTCGRATLVTASRGSGHRLAPSCAMCSRPAARRVHLSAWYAVSAELAHSDSQSGSTTCVAPWGWAPLVSTAPERTQRQVRPDALAAARTVSRRTSLAADRCQPPHRLRRRHAQRWNYSAHPVRGPTDYLE